MLSFDLAVLDAAGVDLLLPALGPLPGFRGAAITSGAIARVAVRFAVATTAATGARPA